MRNNLTNFFARIIALLKHHTLRLLLSVIYKNLLRLALQVGIIHTRRNPACPHTGNGTRICCLAVHYELAERMAYRTPALADGYCRRMAQAIYIVCTPVYFASCYLCRFHIVHPSLSPSDIRLLKGIPAQFSGLIWICFFTDMFLRRYRLPVKRFVNWPQGYDVRLRPLRSLRVPELSMNKDSCHSICPVFKHRFYFAKPVCLFPIRAYYMHSGYCVQIIFCFCSKKLL